MKQSAMLAVNEINKSGGIAVTENGVKNNYKIKLVLINDYYNDAAKANHNFRKMIEKHSLKYIIGGFLSKIILSLMDIMSEKKVLWLSTGGTSSKIPFKINENYNKYKYYFRAGVLDASRHSKVMADFAMKNLLKSGYKKISVICINHSFAKSIVKRTMGLLKIRDFSFNTVKYVDAQTKDFTRFFKNNKNTQGIFCVFLSNEGFRFFRQLKKTELYKKVPVFGIVTPAYFPDFYKKTNKGALNLAYYQSNGGLVDKTGTGNVKRFLEKYKSKYKSKPFWLSQSVYDAFFVYKKAVEKVNSLKVKRIIETIESDSFEYTGMMRLKWKKHNHDLYYGKHKGKMYAFGAVFQIHISGKRYPVYPEYVKVKSFSTH